MRRNYTMNRYDRMNRSRFDSSRYRRDFVDLNYLQKQCDIITKELIKAKNEFRNVDYDLTIQDERKDFLRIIFGYWDDGEFYEEYTTKLFLEDLPAVDFVTTIGTTRWLDKQLGKVCRKFIVDQEALVLQEMDDDDVVKFRKENLLVEIVKALL